MRQNRSISYSASSGGVHFFLHIWTPSWYSYDVQSIQKGATLQVPMVALTLWVLASLPFVQAGAGQSRLRKVNMHEVLHT